MKKYYPLLAITSLLVICIFWSCNKKVKKAIATQVDLTEIKSEETEVTLTDVCKVKENYAPSLSFPEHTPMRNVRVNFHVINTQDGTVGMPDSIVNELVRLIVDSSNVRLASNHFMIQPSGNATPVLNTRFRYIITPDSSKQNDTGIYYHYDDEMAYFNSYRKSVDSTHNMFSKKQFDKYGIQKNEVLNVFFLEHHPDSLANRAKQPPSKRYQQVKGVGYRNWVKITGVRPMYDEFIVIEKNGGDKPAIQRLADYYSRLLNHEIGHSLGLGHTWGSNDGCDDTPKHPNCWYINKQSDNCDRWHKLSNNVMDYNVFMDAYTPCQLGRVHYNFSKVSSSQRKLLRPDWCEYNSEETITINAGEQVIWQSAKDLNGDLIIANNARLTINCVLSLPKGAQIIIEPKGKLTLGEHATISNRCGDQWNGIVTKKLGIDTGVLDWEEGAKVMNVEEQVLSTK